MSAILSIDTLCERYGLLPGELLQRGSTFDLWICNSALRYRQDKEAEGRGDFNHYTEEELMAIKKGAM
jgi:hypothetical protein